MTAQPEHHHDGRSTESDPPMGTLRELRAALGAWGFPGDLPRFESELDAADLDDLSQVREITQAYRHRVLLRLDPAGTAALRRSPEDVAAELRRKLDEAAGQ
ncbi:hypothetical protein OG239_00080 [Streptomyces sp. NBC_00868]|uniref:hypothetical protein n=1 Tax=unclassified Streptomyces TaxID=2593676 RepID=UPI003253C164|nr:hypothetical protein OG239_00080 [Streptomyces sp. NBC_00868]